MHLPTPRSTGRICCHTVESMGRQASKLPCRLLDVSYVVAQTASLPFLLCAHQRLASSQPGPSSAGDLILLLPKMLSSGLTSAAAAAQAVRGPLAVLGLRQSGLRHLQAAVGRIPLVQQAVHGLHRGICPLTTSLLTCCVISSLLKTARLARSSFSAC